MPPPASGASLTSAGASGSNSRRAVIASIRYAGLVAEGQAIAEDLAEVRVAIPRPIGGQGAQSPDPKNRDEVAAEVSQGFGQPVSATFGEVVVDPQWALPSEGARPAPEYLAAVENEFMKVFGTSDGGTSFAT